MEVSWIITGVSVVVAVSNGIGMVCMYLRYIRMTRNAIMTLKATEEGLVEIIDHLPITLLKSNEENSNYLPENR
jgi:hypothetical protein